MCLSFNFKEEKKAIEMQKVCLDKAQSLGTVQGAMWRHINFYQENFPKVCVCFVFPPPNFHVLWNRLS